MEREKLITLVTKAQKGDGQALNDLFNEFYNDVYYFALKTVKDEDIARDVTQESFIEIINTIGNLQEPAAFVKWMKQIAYHQCTRFFKKKKDVIVDEDEDGNTIFDTIKEEKTEFIPDAALDQDDFKKTIMSIIDQLTEEQRAAVLLYYFDELSVKEIAEIQGVSENTVKSRLNYARKGIKTSVEGYEKKTGIKLYSASAAPALLWMLRGYFDQATPESAVTVAKVVSAATGTTVTAPATLAATAAKATLGAKIAALPLATKIVAGAAAAVIILSGSAAIFLNGGNGSDSGAGTTSTDYGNGGSGATNENHEPYLVPAGGVYTTADGKTYKEGELVNTAPQHGDTFKTADYTYKYDLVRRGVNDGVDWVTAGNDEWGVVVNDNKASYAPFETAINGAPVKDISYTFEGCTRMESAPAIPDGVTNLDHTFEGCTSLTSVPTIPDSVTSMHSTFSGCSKLTVTPRIPDGVYLMSFTFEKCTSLTTVTNLPSTLEWMAGTFDGCRALTSVPDLPSKVKSISWAFQNCSSLVKAPVIPASVEKIHGAFLSCTSLSGTVVINANLSTPTIPCNNSCQICAEQNYNSCEECMECCPYSGCFGGIAGGSITLTGSCKYLQEIANTSVANHVRVEN